MQKLGILGGGQLGRMLIQVAMNYNIYTKVLDPAADAPCQPYCHEFVQGSFADEQTVYEFGRTVDVLTIEIEHVNLPALTRLQEEGIMVFPQVRVLDIIQDKGRQKEFYADHQIPTAPFQLCADLAQVQAYSGPFPVVQKLRRLGYDGKGVKVLRAPADLATAFSEPSVLEQFVPFFCEIAVIVARNERGEIVVYPSVEMKFHPEANLVEWLITPSRIQPEIETKARALAIQLAEALSIVGLLAVEMFVTTDGQVLVNEIAPRPHNSGHHTIEANVTSQYDQHLRAVFNWPLGDTTLRSPAAMVNLLGAPGYNGEAHYDGIEKILAELSVYIHLYGKTTTKPYRKMGHITVLDKTVEAALERAQHLEKICKVIA